jgi:hypothetical protein
MTASYQVASTSSSGGVTTYKVNVNTRFNATMVETIVAWVQSNGNVPEVEFSFGGYSYNQTTGAAETFLGLMTPFIVETTFVNEITTYTTGQFYQTGTSSATFGSLTIPLKVYGASNLPITMSGCGYTDVVHAFSMEYGTVPGTSLTLVTNIHVNATDTTAYGTSTDDTTIQIIWVSKA